MAGLCDVVSDVIILVCTGKLKVHGVLKLKP